MAKGHRPRHGSLAFYPRKRAGRVYPKIKSVKKTDEFSLPAFAGYKAGMTHVLTTDTYDKSPTYGQKIAVPVTILECPALFVFGIKAYSKSKTVSHIYADKLDKYLSRVLKIPKKANKQDNMKKIESKLSEINDVRLMVHTQPNKINLKKKPEVFEIPVSGTIEESWNKAKELLGKEVKASEVFEEGEFLDAIGITKGKGTQGPVKRFGIRIQIKKAHGHKRFPGAIGAWTPSRVLHTVPMAGQLGYQRRTEYNKMLMKIGTDPKEIQIRGGISHYGNITSEFMLVQGSVPGPKKRLVIVRKAIRQNKNIPKKEVSEISLESQHK